MWRLTITDPRKPFYLAGWTRASMSNRYNSIIWVASNMIIFRLTYFQEFGDMLGKSGHTMNSQATRSNCKIRKIARGLPHLDAVWLFYVVLVS